MEKNNNNNKINRRDFFKLAGAGTLASATALYGCSGQKNSSDSESAASGEIPTDKMVYRTNPTTGDRVSILGYGCMRWPLLESPAADGNPIDQEAVNELVDYAIAHGVNYFDTAPVYIQGFSEKSTGIALKRHPREKVFIATKMSNHRMAGRGMSPARIFKDSEEMYRRSLRDLQTDYLAYYLLHAVGGDKGIGMTPEQQARLQDEFKTLLVRTYAGALSQVTDQSIVVKPLRAAAEDKDVLVRTEIVGRGDPIQLDYRLEKTPGDGAGWKIYNLNVLGVWLVETYRGQFAQEINAKGIEGLIDTLAARNKTNAGTAKG